MSEAKLVYHIAFGYGTVLGEAPFAAGRTMLTVQFISGETKRIVSDMVVSLNEKICNYFVKEVYAKLFYMYTRRQAEQLYAGDKVSPPVFGKNAFSVAADVIDGSKKYKAEYQIPGGIYLNVKTSCTCGQTDCAHLAAVGRRVAADISAARQVFSGTAKNQAAAEQQQEQTPSAKETLKTILSESRNIISLPVTGNTAAVPLQVKELSEKYFSSLTSNELAEYLTFLKKEITYTETGADYLLYALLSVSTAARELAAQERRYPYFIKRVKEMTEVMKPGYYARSDDAKQLLFFYYYFRSQYAAAVSVTMRFRSQRQTILSILEAIIKIPGVCSDMEDGIREYVCKNGAFSQTLLPVLPLQRQVECVTIFGANITIGKEHLGALSQQELSALIRKNAVEDRAAAIALLSVKEEDREGTCAALRSSVRGYCNSDIRQAVWKKIQELPDSQLFSRYLRFACYGNLPGQDAPLPETPVPAIIENYFTYCVEVKRNETDIYIYYCLNEKTSNSNVYTREESAGGETDFGSFGQMLPEKYKDYIAGRCRELFRDTIRETKRKLQTEIEADKRRAEKEMLSSRINTLTREARRRKVYLRDEACASLQFILSRNTISYYVDREKHPFLLSLKIGLKKFYVVKDIHAFLERFETEESFEYGKGFTFTHSTENIRKDQAEALNLMLLHISTIPYSASEKRYMPLSGRLLTSFLQIIQGQSLFFDGKEYAVTLRPLPWEVKLSGSYTISLTPNLSEEAFLDGGNSLFVLHEEEDEKPALDTVRVSREQKPLVLFAAGLNGACIRPVFEEFRDKVYPKFHTAITVAETLKPLLKLSELEIRAKFDYGNGIIHLATEYRKGDTPVQRAALKSEADTGRAEEYEDYIASLGFENNMLTDDGQVLSFFCMDMTELKKLCTVYLSEAVLKKQVIPFSRQSIRIRYESGIMEAFTEASAYSDEELAKILSAIRHKKKYILLSSDRIIPLDSAEAASFEKTVSELGLNEKALSERKEISIGQALRAFAHEENCRIDDYLYRMMRDISGFKTAAIPLPALSAKLRPYQEEGYHWLKILSDYHVGGILADDMGLGKTLEAIALLSADTAKAPSLIVTPKSVVFNWVQEIRRFAPELPVSEIYGTPEARKKSITAISKKERRVYVTSYDSLRNDIDAYTMPFNYMILDEAQYIKNVTAQKSRSVKSIRAAHRFALTGTPVENNALDLWSIFDFLMPGYFEDVTAFRRHCTGDEEYLKRTARRVAPFVLRRTKQDVLKDLPEKYERIETVDMTDGQRKMYDAFRMEARTVLASGQKTFDILPYLTKLRELCVDPGLLAEGYTGGSGKLDALEKLIDQSLAEGHRLLVFSQFVKALERVETLLDKKKLPYFTITGATAAKDRISMATDFNAGTGADIFLISLKAGGTGLNLVGADMVIHLDPWWNTASEDQASDRAHRIGQTRNVEVIRLICRDSVEQKVTELQNTKKALIDALISGSDASVTSVTPEDIQFLLEE